jgi:hypothetical protein
MKGRGAKRPIGRPLKAKAATTSEQADVSQPELQVAKDAKPDGCAEPCDQQLSQGSQIEVIIMPKISTTCTSNDVV